MVAISYGLTIDEQTVAPEVLAAIERIDVEDHADLADIMRLRLGVGVRADGSAWNVIDDDLFPRLARLTLTVSVGTGSRQTLLDAYVVETRIELASAPGRSRLEVVALDPTVLMNLEEKVRAWPDMADSDIASTLFGEYGFQSEVEPTQPSRAEIDAATVQRETDIQFLRRLAVRNGYEVYVEIDPASGVVEGHFHPPRTEEAAQGVLSVNLGAATNVDAFRARFDMLRPATVAVAGIEAEGQSDQSAEASGTTRPELGAVSALPSERQRRVLLSQTGLAQGGELQTLAQAVVDQSAWAIVAEGDLNAAAYGGVLRAKRPVMVRGAGRTFSGRYYVERVLHSFDANGYVQRFALRRNALGLTGQESFVDDGALPS